MKLEDVKSGVQEPGDCGNPMEPPRWLDMDRFRKGQIFIQDNIFINFIFLHFSMVIGLSVVNLLQPLVFTNQSDTPIKAMKRYAMTGKHLNWWYMENVWEYPNGVAHKSIKLVRSMHNSVAKSMKTTYTDKLHMSQYDMSLVQSGFIAAIILYGKRIGIKCTEADMDNFTYFWRCLGYLLGINDKYNICKESYKETYEFCEDVETKIVLPSLQNPPMHFQKMVNAYCDGMNILKGFRLHTVAADTALVLDVMGDKTISKSLSWSDTLRFYFWKILMFMLKWCPGFRILMNKYIAPILLKKLDLFLQS